MYGEDVDLSYRLLKGGFENWYLPRTHPALQGREYTEVELPICSRLL